MSEFLDRYKAQYPEFKDVPDVDLARSLYDQYFKADPRFPTRGDFLKANGFDPSLGAAAAEGGVDLVGGFGKIADQVYRGVTGNTDSINIGKAIRNVPIVGPALSDFMGPDQTVKGALSGAEDLKHKDIRYANPAVKGDGSADWSDPLGVVGHGIAGASAPIGAIVASGGVLTPFVIGSALGNSVDQRMKNDGRSEANAKDYLYSAPGAILSGWAPMKLMSALHRGGLARNILGNAAIGATGAAATDIGTTVDTKAGVDPSRTLDAALTGAAVGGTLGGSVRLAGAPFRRGAASADDPIKAAVAQRLLKTAESIGAKIDDVDPNSNTGVKRVLEKSRTDLLAELKDRADTLSEQLRDPASQAALRSVRNAVEGRIGTADIKELARAVGGTREGQDLIHLARQLDVVRELRRAEQTGGVSGWLKSLSPMAKSNRYDVRNSGFQNFLAAAGIGAGALADPVTTGAGLAGYFGARGLARVGEKAYGAVTGRGDPGFTVKQFTQRYGSKTPATPDQNLPSVVEQRAAAASARTAEIAGERAAALDRLQKAREQNVVSNPFDKLIFERTGLKPNDAAYGVQELLRSGLIREADWDAYHNDPKKLMRGNVGNYIADMLGSAAEKGALQRDPTWQRQSSTPVQHVGGYDPRQVQAEANQRRISDTIQRISADKEFSSSTRLVLNQAVAHIGKANNQTLAKSIRDQALGMVDAKHRQKANANYLSPLVRQIRHATEADALAARAGNVAERAQAPQPMTRENMDRIMSRTPSARAAFESRLFKAMQAKADEIKTSKTVQAPKPNFYRGGNETSRQEAEAYKASAGIDAPPMTGKLDMPKSYIEKVADWFQGAKHEPDNPVVKTAYEALSRETLAQYEAIGKDLKVEPYHGVGEPYRNSGEMIDDVRNNRHLWFFRTDNGFGEGPGAQNHPMLAPTKHTDTNGKPLVVNDIFRIVHDYFGHTQNGYQFGPVGEYNAFHEHARMFSPTAIPALAAETLAQNAWVNNGPHMRGKDIPAKDRPFAEQKATVVPQELLDADPNAGRAKAPNPEAVTKAVEGINAGGTSIDVFNNVDYGGKPFIAVSAYPERSQIMTGKATDPMVRGYIADNADLLGKPHHMLGGWFNTKDGKTYIDVSVAVPKSHQAEAVQLAKISDQIAVFDLEHFKEHPTGGKGTGEKVAPITARQKLVDEIATKPSTTTGAEFFPVLKGAADMPGIVSPSNPTAVKASADPKKVFLPIGVDAMKATPALFEHNVNVFKDKAEYPGAARVVGDAAPARAVELLKAFMVKNLTFLYDAYHRAWPERATAAKEWYPGARKLSKDIADAHGVPLVSVVGAVARLSPGTDWYINVARVSAILDIRRTARDHVLDPKMDSHAAKIYQKPHLKALYDEIAGKKLSEVTSSTGQAAWIRLYSETHTDRHYREIFPDGTYGDWVRTAKGVKAKMTWSSIPDTEKAIRILDSGGDPAIIGDLLGAAHKIREFHNDILFPDSPTHGVVIDTHAVAAALMRPLAQTDTPVAQNFGNIAFAGQPAAKSSAITGVSGTYGIYADAYRAAAKKLGILPRELQSVVWEGARLLFAAKSGKMKADVDATWNKFQNGKISADKARQLIYDSVGGIKQRPSSKGGQSEPIRGRTDQLDAKEQHSNNPI